MSRGIGVLFKDRLLKKALAAYNGEHVLERVLKHGEDALHLGGQVKKMTVYFQRIAGFTEIAERVPPEALVHVMTEYLTVMAGVIENHKGIVDRAIGIGDTMVAFWGADDETDHADKACACAMEAVERGRNLSARWQAKGIPSLDVAVGINSGRAMMGNFGTPTRFQYTILGEAVNLASRLAGANAQYGTDILLSEFTREQLRKPMKLGGVDAISVKNNPVNIYTIGHAGTPA
jgi:adenylate cyclase